MFVWGKRESGEMALDVGRGVMERERRGGVGGKREI